MTQTATTPPLFANLTAFFSPLLPPSTRALWCFHGGLLATHNTHIHLFFGVWHSNDDLVDRLRSIGLEVHDHTWLIDSVAKRDRLPLELYSFSHLDAHACRTACLLPPPRGPCIAAAGSEPFPPTITRPASSKGPEEATSSIRDNERSSSALSFSSDSDTSLKTQRRLVSPDKRRAQQILPSEQGRESPTRDTHEAMSGYAPGLPSFSPRRASAELDTAASPADLSKSTSSPRRTLPQDSSQAFVPFLASLGRLDSFCAATASALPVNLNPSLQPPPVSQAPFRSLGIDMQLEAVSTQGSGETVLETSEQVLLRPEPGEWTRSRNPAGQAEAEAKLAQQLTPPTGSPHLPPSPPSAQAPLLSPPTTIPTEAEHTSLTLDSRPTASSPAAAYSPVFTADLPRSSTRSPPSIPASELFAALSSAPPDPGLGLGEGEDGDGDGVRGSDSAEASRWRWRTGLRVMKHREGGFEVRKISGAAGKGAGGGA